MGASAAFERFDNFLSRLNILFERKDAEVDAALFVRVLFAGAEQFIAARFDFGYLFIDRVELRGKFIYLLLRLSLNFFELCGALCGAALLRFEVIERRLGSFYLVVLSCAVRPRRRIFSSCAFWSSAVTACPRIPPAPPRLRPRALCISPAARQGLFQASRRSF